MVTTSQTAGTIYYPEEDDQVSESNKHYIQGAELVTTLRAFFVEQPTIFVGGNSFVYYQEGDPKQCFSPDAFVVLGVRPRPLEERGSYKIWEEGVPPTLIVELASQSTRKADQGDKLQLYAQLGVREYFLFDPLGTLLRPRLQGYRLPSAGRYMRLAGAELDSEILGLRLVVHEGWLRLRDPHTGDLLPTPAEEHAAYLREQEARLAAEAEIARLRAALAALQGGLETDS